MPTSKSKRKKPKQKSSILSAKLPLLRYQGSMQFPLAGSQNYEDFKKDCTFTGDFVSINKRNMIFSVPRKYQFFIGLSDWEGFIFEESEYLVQEPLTKDELTQVLKQISNEQIQEHIGKEIDLSKSYVRIQL